MKTIYLLLLLALGLGLVLAGALFKIQHYPGADALLLAGLGAALAAGLLGLLRLVRSR